MTIGIDKLANEIRTLLSENKVVELNDILASKYEVSKSKLKQAASLLLAYGYNIYHLRKDGEQGNRIVICSKDSTYKDIYKTVGADWK